MNDRQVTNNDCMTHFRSELTFWFYKWGRLKSTTHQHGCSEIKVRAELGDEDVRGDHVFPVHGLHLPDDVRHPLKLLLGTRHPQEVHLRQPDVGEILLERKVKKTCKA